MRTNRKMRLFALVAVLAGAVVALLLYHMMQSRVWADDILAGSSSSSIRLRQIARIPMKGDRADGQSPLAVAWNPDGTRLGVSFDWGYQISVLDTATWREVSRIKGKTFQPQRQLAFWSNSEMVTTPADNETGSPAALAFYDSETGRLIKELLRPAISPTSFTTAIAVSSSKRYITYIDGGIRQSALVFDARSGQFKERLATPSDSTTFVLSAGPDDQLAVNVSFLGERTWPSLRKEIYLFDIASNAVSRILAGHVPGVRSLAWRPGGRLIASGASISGGRHPDSWTRDPDPIRIWDTTTGALMASFVGQYDPIDQLAWHPSKAVLATRSAKRTGEYGYAIRLWSVDRKEMIFEFPIPQPGSVNVLSFHPQTGHLVSAWGDALYVFEVLGLPQ